MVNSRSKGQRGEREAIKLLQPIVDRVYGVGELSLERNLDQWRSGGYDIRGMEWCALEVKRQESSSIKSWWQQTTDQARDGQVPVLLWRRNHQPWRARVRTPVVTVGWSTEPLDIDLELDPFLVWFELMLRWHRQPPD